jgi:very-short-patch-repair endonuclease
LGTYTESGARKARRLRANSTDAERKLWSILRDRRLDGHKFVRQLPVGPYVADFACREANLIVEVDGGQHSGSRSDEIRTAELAKYGYRVVRFWNTDVLLNLDGVHSELSGELREASSPGRFAVDLSLEGRGDDGAP